MKYHLVGISLAVLYIQGICGQSDFALEGEEYSLDCIRDEGAIPQYWMLHGKGTAYNVGETMDSITVLSDGTLRFKEVMVEHEGDHLCVSMKTSTEFVGTPVNMRVRPLPPTDLWNEVYKSQFITGLVAAIICAFIFVSGCLVFKYRYREPKAVLLHGGEESGHVNPAMDEEGDSTKM